jgi:sugar phosphate isomerase/epimerase
VHDAPFGLGPAGAPEQRALMPTLACRFASFGDYAENAAAHLAMLGIERVETYAPADAAETDALRRTLNAYGLRAGSLQVPGPLDAADLLDQIAARLPAFAALDCRHMLVPAKSGDLDHAAACARLRELGQFVQPHGLIVMVETHPPLAENAEVARRTMEAVGLGNVGINYDPANVYFYNRGVDAVRELEPIVEFVVGVHLKDTPGGYREWNFPALGRGVVDFRGLFRLLDAVGFDGPYTLEIEGVEGETASEALTVARVAESLGYLRGLGRLG